METAIECASMGMHLFIEKPLCHNFEGWDSLLNKVRKNRLLTYVACQLRFDPIIQYLKKNLAAHRPFYSRVTCSSYLPDWRPERDYKTIYSSRSDMGGGVLLDLIHEPDYCHYLFGPIERVTGRAGNCSALEIQSEDHADMTLHHASGFFSHIHLDYFGRKTRRTIEVFGRDIHLEAELIERTVTAVADDGSEMKRDFPMDRDYPYLQELRYFFQCVENNEVPMNNVEEHMSVLMPVLMFKDFIGL
jgi:predicted dehydrogenase